MLRSCRGRRFGARSLTSECRARVVTFSLDDPDAKPGRHQTFRGTSFLRRIRQTVRRTQTAIARVILAAGLLFCVLSSALPAEAILNPSGVMPCCRGMKGMGGECHGDSCPMHLGPRAKTRKVSQLEPVCGAEHLLQKIVKSPLPSPQDFFEQAHSDDHARAEVEHDHGGSVSPRNTPQQQTSVGVASLAKPCPSDCGGGVTGSFTGLRRPAQLAALTDGLRPRPPNVEADKYAPPALLKVTSALRRSHPPRAPPTGLDSRTI